MLPFPRPSLGQRGTHSLPANQGMEDGESRVYNPWGPSSPCNVMYMRPGAPGRRGAHRVRVRATWRSRVDQEGGLGCHGPPPLRRRWRRGSTADRPMKTPRDRPRPCGQGAAGTLRTRRRAWPWPGGTRDNNNDNDNDESDVVCRGVQPGCAWGWWGGGGVRARSIKRLLTVGKAVGTQVLAGTNRLESHRGRTGAVGRAARHLKEGAGGHPPPPLPLPAQRCSVGAEGTCRRAAGAPFGRCPADPPAAQRNRGS